MPDWPSRESPPGSFFASIPPGGSPLPLAGVAAGLGIGALGVGPALRAINASALGDLLATRFPHPLLKLYFAGLLFAIGALVAAAGFETALDAFAALFASSRGAAATIVAIILALMVVPGGLAGLLWAGAASAGVLIIILALPIAAQFLAEQFGDRAAASRRRNLERRADARLGRERGRRSKSAFAGRPGERVGDRRPAAIDRAPPSAVLAPARRCARARSG